MIADIFWSGVAGASLKINALYPNGIDAVLMYHAVGNPDGYGNVPPGRLRSDIQCLQQHYEIVSLSQLVNQTTDTNRIALTFDDGLTDFYEAARPVLHDLAAPATVFVVAGEMKDNQTNLTANNTMSWSEVATLVDDELITIGNHTYTHPQLSSVANKSKLEYEIIKSKELLENRLSTNIKQFCYPHGDVSKRARDLVAESHQLAVSTQPNLMMSNYDQFSIPRITAHNQFNRICWNLSIVRYIIHTVHG
jgi:peptidoglycan/xylan/chitin deacetylase (PgdA/CDA1 family)